MPCLCIECHLRHTFTSAPIVTRGRAFVRREARLIPRLSARRRVVISRRLSREAEDELIKDGSYTSYVHTRVYVLQRAGPFRPRRREPETLCIAAALFLESAAAAGDFFSLPSSRTSLAPAGESDKWLPFPAKRRRKFGPKNINRCQGRLATYYAHFEGH